MYSVSKQPCNNTSKYRWLYFSRKLRFVNILGTVCTFSCLGCRLFTICICFFMYFTYFQQCKYQFYRLMSCACYFSVCSQQKLGIGEQTFTSQYKCKFTIAPGELPVATLCRDFPASLLLSTICQGPDRERLPRN